MRRHSIVVRLNPADTKKVTVRDKGSLVTDLHFIDGERRLGYGIGQMLGKLAERGMYPQETAIDLAILAAAVTAADTRISRSAHAQDSWTREIDLYVPVAIPDVWSVNATLIERLLKFLTGDHWRIAFRPRRKGMAALIDRPHEIVGPAFDSVCLFSGGLDSFVGAIDLLHTNKDPLFVSHYRDASTKSQLIWAERLGKVYGNLSARHVRANVGFNKNDMPGLGSEKTTRGRSFIFFALACLAADALDGLTPVYVPENGLISLNVPLDPLRLGAWSTRTTHPFYMARWQDLLKNMGLEVQLLNPYRFKTKGEMLSACKNKTLLRKNSGITISCSSISKGRWKKLPQVHCGYCTPCLIRRASIETAFSSDPTEYFIADLQACALDARKAEASDVRSFQLMGRRLSQNPSHASILVHKTGPLNDYSPQEIANYGAVFRRGIAEVGTLVDDVVIQAA